MSSAGIVRMTIACAFFTVNDAAMKVAITELPITQAVFLRGLFVSIPLLLFFGKNVRDSFNEGLHLKSQLLCATLVCLSVALFVGSLTFLKLSVAVTAGYTTPLFVVLLAPIMLKERLTGLKFTVVCIGFIGAVLVVVPSLQELTTAVILPLLAAMVNAWRDIELRRLALKANTFSIMSFTLIFITIVYFVPAVLTWSMPSGRTILILVGASAGFAAGIYLSVDALRRSEASLVIPFKYSGVIWSGLVGLAIWGDIPTLLQLFGAALVVASGIYVLERTVALPEQIPPT